MDDGQRRLLDGDGIEMSLEEAQRFYESVGPASDKIVAEMGLRALDHPTMGFRAGDDYPCLPTNLMDLSDRELGELHTRFEAWQTYLGPLIADLETRTSAAKDWMEHIEASLREGLSGTDDKRRRKARLDRRYVIAKTDWRVLDTALIKALAHYKTFAGGEKVVSRNITLRQQQNQTFNRSDNIQSARNIFRRSAMARGSETLPYREERDPTRAQQMRSRPSRPATSTGRPPIRPGRRVDE